MNYLAYGVSIGLLLVSGALAADEESFSVEAVTSPPHYHWFGYYDKWQFDPSDRYLLGMQVDFEGRSPEPDDVIEIGMIDLQDGDRWIKLGESNAWGWQQGCMLQWLPGSRSEVIWNDREDGRFVSHIMDVFTQEKRTIPHPVYALSPDGKTAVTTDFRRVQDTRPGYGYAGLADPYADERAPEQSGIWLVDLETGEAELIISLAEIAQVPASNGGDSNMDHAKHWFNHLLFSPNGERFIFLHRWRVVQDGEGKQQGGFQTRMFTSDRTGEALNVVDPYGGTSHFIWRDALHILAWAWHPSHGSAFYLFEDGTDEVEVVDPEKMPRNGHCTYVPHTNNEWILNDTYPDGERQQHVYLYHVPTRKKVKLGRFYSPPQYSGEWRVDTHPRSSRDGTKVVIDSAHEGNGRQMYMIDISSVISSEPQ